MNFSEALLQTSLEPHILGLSLCAARIAPIAFLCPLLGGSAAPTTVRLAITLALAGTVHFAGGVAAPVEAIGLWAFLALTLKEVVLGMVIGLLASLPFDSARIGGRFIDLFRGSSAEAALPVAGSREAVTGDALHQLLVALVVTGGLFPLVLGGLIRSFKWVPVGTFALSEVGAVEVAKVVGVALATGLAIGAPIAAGCLLVDWFLGLMSRGAPQLQLTELSAPLRIIGGGAMLWLGVGVIAERLLHGVELEQRAMQSLLGAIQ